MSFVRSDILINLQVWNLTKVTYDITNKTLPEKHVLQKYDFLFVWNENLIIYTVNFLFVIISLCMECKFEFKNNFFFFNCHNFLDIWQMRLMTFATVIWMRQLTCLLIYKNEIWKKRHMTLATYDITKHSQKNMFFKNMIFFLYGMKI